MAASSSGSRRYDVFPSFHGEDVRKAFLSHLLMALEGRSISTFIDNGIERSLQIAPALKSAIRESSIAIVVFSKNYASSTWCLNELVEIHECYKKLDQVVIPIFYDVDPSDVRKQTGEFGKVFKVTCEGKPEDQKQRWVQALVEVANMAGEDLQNWPDEAHVVEKIANDVSNKLISPSNSLGELVGLEAHLEAMKSILCLESKEARMVGIWGTSGIGKSTIGRALFSQLSGQFPLRNFVTYKSTDQDVFGMKSSWEQKFLSKILGQKNIKIEHYGVVERRLKDKKVLIVLDNVDNLKFLKTLVGKTEWFGPGSRIIVITQDRQLLKAHDIDLLYEVKFPSQYLALKMLCRSAFEQDSPPDGFMDVAFKVAELVGNLPLGLSVLGSSLRGRKKKEWMEMLPELQNGLNGNILKTLRFSYDRLAEKDQYIFHYIAWLFNGRSVKFINDFLGDVNIGLKTLADKSLIRITPDEKVEMHNLLEKLGREIDRAESQGNPGKRRFLEDAEEILDVFTDKTGTRTVLGIFFYASSPSQIKKPCISIDEKSFEDMRNLQFLIIHDYSGGEPSESRLRLPNGLVYLPRKLKLLEWDHCPLKCLPSNFKAEYLIELRMENSELEKLWEGTQLLGSLKTMIMRNSKYLKEIPDLCKAINLERVDISNCKELESFPSPLNSESLEYLNLRACPRLKNYPEIYMYSSSHGIRIEVADCLWNTNLPGLDYLDCLKRFNPSKFRPEHLVSLTVKGNMLEKLWEGVQSLGSLVRMDLSECANLTKIPDLSKATNLEYLILSNCKKLVGFPSTIRNLQKLLLLEMKECTKLEVLPVDVNLSSLQILDLRGCSSLRSFPQISKRIYLLKLDGDGRELILRSFFKSTMVLSGGEVPTHFEYRAYGNSITVTLPQSSLSQKFLRFNACVVVEPLTHFSACMSVHIHFNGKRYMYTVAEDMPLMCKTDHLVLCSFKFRPTGLPIKLDFNDVEFKFSCLKRIKECGIRLLNVFSYPDDSDGSSITEFPYDSDGSSVTESHHSDGSSVTESLDNSGRSYKTEYIKRLIENFDVETESSKNQMWMTLEKCEEYFNLPCGKIVPDTGRGESSSVSYPCLEGEALCVDSMITKQQDAQIPIVET